MLCAKVMLSPASPVQIDLKRIADGNLVLATAEQWDRLSRRWRQRRAVSDLSLFISDELHLLGNSDTGPALEVVVSRMRAVAKLLAKPIRMVGLAASMADAKDVGDWMGVPAHALFNFPPGARATPLEIHIQSLDIASFEARLQVRARAAACLLAVLLCGGLIVHMWCLQSSRSPSTSQRNARPCAAPPPPQHVAWALVVIVPS